MFMNKIIVISSPHRYAWGFWFHHSRAAAKFVCLPTYPHLTTKYTSSNAFMYGSEYHSNEFGHGGGKDLPICVWGSTVEFRVLVINGKFSCCMYNALSMEYHGDPVRRYSDYEVATQYMLMRAFQNLDYRAT